MSINGSERVTKVNINGEIMDLGSEMTSEQAMNQMSDLDLMGSVAGATPSVVNGVLNFTYARGDKGLN